METEVENSDELELSAVLEQKEFAWKLENVGLNQLQRICASVAKTGSPLSTDEILGLVQKEAKRRDAKAKELLVAEKFHPGTFTKSFLQNLETNWPLLECLVDGNQSPLAKKLRELLPLVCEYAQVESINGQTKFQDYQFSQEGLHGYDWSLFDKAVCRTMTKLTGLFQKDIETFQDKNLSGLNPESFDEIATFVQKIKKIGLSPLFEATLLHLDIAKGGNPETRQRWSSHRHIDLLVHNQAGAKLLEERKVLEAPELFAQVKVPVSEEERHCLGEFFRQMVAYHGLIGQGIRGEVTPYIFTDFTDYVRKNYSILVSALGRLSAGSITPKQIPDFIANSFCLINLIDTAAVKEGLYTEELHQGFLAFGREFTQTITPDEQGNFPVGWDGIVERNVLRFQPETSPEAYTRRFFLADRLLRLRAGRIKMGEDPKITEGLVFMLPEKVFEKFFELQRYCQHWYTENATAVFSPENQMKMLFLAAKAAEAGGINVNDNYHVNFMNLMEGLRQNGQFNEAKVMVVENFLRELSWDQLMDNNYLAGLFKKREKGITAFTGTIGGQNSIAVDFYFSQDAQLACDVINELKDTADPRYQAAKRQLEELYGLASTWLARGLGETEYMSKMDAATVRKINDILRHLESLPFGKLKVLSLGAGTGALEEKLARLLLDSEVMALDVETTMIEKIKQKAAVIDRERVENPHLGKLIPLQIDAKELSKRIGVGSLDAIVACSFFHEIFSQFDQHEIGQNAQKFLQEIAKALKPGGRLIIRDFVQPENPEETVIMKVGQIGKPEEMEPLLFLERFLRDFPGKIENLKKQLEDLKKTGKWGLGAELKVTRAEMVEIAAHYSWSVHYQAEIKERYVYKTAPDYAKYVAESFTQAGFQAKVLFTETYLQPGYPEHVSGRLNFYDMDGNLLGLPGFTGVIVVEKLK